MKSTTHISILVSKISKTIYVIRKLQYIFLENNIWSIDLECWSYRCIIHTKEGY